jgi:tetratricopeptide (TPR) repeat protein
MLETLREYALKKLDQSEDVPALRSGHARWFVSLAHQAAAALRTGNEREWTRAFSAETDNVSAALDWTIAQLSSDGDAEAALGFAADVASLWIVSGRWLEARSRLERILSHPRSARPSPARFDALVAAATIAARRDDFGTADQICGQTLEIAKMIGDRTREAASLGHLGVNAQMTGRYAEAKELHERALSIAGEVGDRHRESFQSDCALARDQYTAGLAIARERKDKRGEAHALSVLGAVQIRLGEAAGAIGTLEESVRTQRELGDTWAVATGLSTLGAAYLESGHHDRAVPCLLESIEALTSMGDCWGSVHALLMLMKSARVTGDLARLRWTAERVLPLALQSGSVPGIVQGLLALAHVSASPPSAPGLERSFRLLGAAEARFEDGRSSLQTFEQAELRQIIDSFAAGLEEKAIGFGSSCLDSMVSARAEGRRSSEDAVRWVLSAT